MPMVNSFGATKKAPYAEALTRKTTAAAPRILLVIIFLDAVHCPTYTIPEALCFDTVSKRSLANPLLSHRFRKPRGRGPLPPTNSRGLFFQKIFPEKPYRRQKNDVKRNQERQPIPAQHWLLRKQRRRRLCARDEQRRQQRKQEQRKQQLAHARLRRNRRKRRAGNRKPKTPQEQHQRKLRYDRK